MARTIEQLAQEVLDVQDACNLSGVLGSAYRAACDLRRVLDAGTDTINRHPIMVLWADKIAHLTDTQTIGNDRVSAAYRAVYAIVEAKEKEVLIQRMI